MATTTSAELETPLFKRAQGLKLTPPVNSAEKLVASSCFNRSWHSITCVISGQWLSTQRRLATAPPKYNLAPLLNSFCGREPFVRSGHKPCVTQRPVTPQTVATCQSARHNVQTTPRNYRSGEPEKKHTSDLFL